MNILFYWRTQKQFDPSNVFETPFGGAEISSLNLARELSAKGHKITICCNVPRVEIVNKVRFMPYDQLKTLDHIEYMIMVRLDPVISKRLQTFNKRPKHIIVWSGDAFDQSNNQMLHDPMMRDSLDAFVCKSNWQRETLAANFVYDDMHKKLYTMFNGVNLDYYKDQNHDKNKFIHASVAFRGVEHLLQIWPRLLRTIGDHIELKIFSKIELYSGDPASDAQYQGLYNQLGAMPNVTLMEPVTQKELAGHMCESGMMLYPNTFMESSCGTALESMAAGTPIITTNFAGLAETVNMIKGGILVDRGNDYIETFVTRTHELWKNDTGRQEMVQSSRQAVRQYSWTEVAKRWVKFLKSL